MWIHSQEYSHLRKISSMKDREKKSPKNKEEKGTYKDNHKHRNNQAVEFFNVSTKESSQE